MVEVAAFVTIVRAGARGWVRDAARGKELGALARVLEAAAENHFA